MKKVALSIHAHENFSLDSIKGLIGLDYIHIDVMDGIFVSNSNLNLKIFKLVREHSNIPIIAHLMVVNPYDYIAKLIDYIDVFLFHFEIEGDKARIINEIKKQEKKVGLVINPETKISEIYNFLNRIDYILVLGVKPGWSGQNFIPNTINKVNQLAYYKKEYNFQIDVDGGINLENAKSLRNADILTSASTILESENPNDIIKRLSTINDN